MPVRSRSKPYTGCSISGKGVKLLEFSTLKRNTYDQYRTDFQCGATNGRIRPILLKNSFAAARLSVVEKVDPLRRSQSDANEPVDGLKTLKIAARKARHEFFNRIGR